MKQIVVFGGTFDPVHLGHLRIIETIGKYISPDLILIIPCGDPPHRSQSVANGQHRLEMLRIACGNMARVEVDDRELRNEGPSYSYRTLIELRQENPDAQLYLALGWDSLVSFNTWHRWQDILSIVSLLVVKRVESKQSIPTEIDLPIAQIDAHLPKTNAIVELPFEELPFSSTQVREQLALGSSTKGMLAPQVLNYIHENNLYQS